MTDCAFLKTFAGICGGYNKFNSLLVFLESNLELQFQASGLQTFLHGQEDGLLCLPA